MDITDVKISRDSTHHNYHNKPLYDKRYTKVMSFHTPGVAAVQDGDIAYHINTEGKPVYNRRFIKTFGFYNNVSSTRMIPVIII